LMWSDWTGDVRRACAATLLRTGHGTAIQEQVIEKINQGNEQARCIAVIVISDLQIWSERLVPSFLECLHDTHSSVRLETCRSYSRLSSDTPPNDQIIAKIMSLVSDDPSGKVKLAAIRALIKRAAKTPELQRVILRTARFDRCSEVRAEACHAICTLGLDDDEVITVLRNRLIVETNPSVIRQIVHALNAAGVSSDAENPVCSLVKKEVRRLCSKDFIGSQILRNEKEANEKRLYS